MNAALEFHDSTLAAIERRGSVLTVVLDPGYVHKSEQRAGTEARTGWHHVVHLAFEGGEAHGDVSSLPEELWGGSLQCGDTPYPHLVPAPLQFTGTVSLQLTCLSGRSLAVVGRAVSVALVGVGTYVEEVPSAPLKAGPGAV